MGQNHYNKFMSNKFDDYFSEAKDIRDFEKRVSACSREEINELMLDIHTDTEYLMDCYAPPKLIRYYHELLSRLIKTYGH